MYVYKSVLAVLFTAIFAVCCVASIVSSCFSHECIPI